MQRFPRQRKFTPINRRIEESRNRRIVFIDEHDILPVRGRLLDMRQQVREVRLGGQPGIEARAELLGVFSDKVVQRDIQLGGGF